MTLNSIVANFQTFKLVDLLDILIIAFLIYQLLGFVNRTRAGQLAKGALIVMAVYLVANILNMRTVTWLLNSLLQVGLLTLVVLFQPEIRRALERMGQTSIPFPKPTSGPIASSIKTATTTPASRARGAAPSSPSATRQSAFRRPRPARSSCWNGTPTFLRSSAPARL